MRGRAWRRHHTERMKLRARRKIEQWGYENPSPARIGLWYSTHGQACSCWGCGNPRKWFDQRTLQEIRHDIGCREWEREYNVKGTRNR